MAVFYLWIYFKKTKAYTPYSTNCLFKMDIVCNAYTTIFYLFFYFIGLNDFLSNC